MKLKPYPECKDSGIKWIGEIPEGWEIHRLKFLLSSLESGSRETGGGSQLDEGVFSLGGEHINWNGTLNLENPKLISEKYYNTMNQGKLKTNDVLLVKDGATIGKTAILKQMDYEKMAVNEHVFLMRPNRRIKPKLLYYLICGDSGFRQIKLTETGSAQGGVNQDFKGVVSFTISPEMKEQDILINFLDKKTAKIDTLIEKDKKLIELLKEKRTALINHAVTKGLDQNAKLKDSGIPWIGKIPEGWEVHRFKFKETVIMGQSPDSESYNYEYNGYPFLQGNAEFSGIHPNPSIWCNVANKHALKNDILLSVRAPIGAINIADQKYGIGRGLCAIRVKTNNLKYIFYQLITCVDYLNSIGTGSTYTAISTEDVMNLPILYPPLPEQTTIANYLDKTTARIDKNIEKIEKKIKLLEEYKKSLIHHVVTGKVDVRGVEA